MEENAKVWAIREKSKKVASLKNGFKTYSKSHKYSPTPRLAKLKLRK
jgi:hypothetical protein